MVSVLVFGSHSDPQAWEMTEELKARLPGLSFLNTSNPHDLLEARGEVRILDVVAGLDRPRVISINQLSKRRLYTAHDFDLGYFLQLLKGSGMIDDLRIIGIPEKWDETMVNDVADLLRS